MPTVILIHWNIPEIEEKVSKLRAAGHRVHAEVPKDFTFFRTLKANPPDAFVIDLSRLPMQGRDIGMGIRRNRVTRYLPLVFVGGNEEKIERIKKSLPDAVYTTWGQIRNSLRAAIAHPRENPIVPSSTLAGYSGTPLTKKLGIKAHTHASLVNAPDGFEKLLGELPEAARIERKLGHQSDVTIWFVTSRRELESLLTRVATETEKLWIVWSKKAADLKTDLSERSVRKVCLSAGLVDYKICAIDKTWSGLLFTWRKPKMPHNDSMNEGKNIEHKRSK
jgi:hypothetical protein